MPKEPDPDLAEFVDEPVPPVAPGAKRGPSAVLSAGPPSKKSGTSSWVIVIAVVGVLALIVLPLLAAIAIYGVRRYIVQAKVAEGRVNSGVLARGIADCAAQEGELPETSSKVPLELEMVRAVKYQSSLDDWSDDTFRCARFRLTEPQYFQYQWVLKDDVDAGSVVAEADLDGDGVAEIRLELEVDCSGDSCRVADTMKEQGL